MHKVSSGNFLNPFITLGKFVPKISKLRQI